MLYQRKEIPELFYLKHRHDNNDQYVNYEDKILNSSLSPYMYENNLMNSWLNKMQPLVALLFDQMNIVKNFKNYMVDKYEFKHSK
jgi:hypothetical protein